MSKIKIKTPKYKLIGVVALTCFFVYEGFQYKKVLDVKNEIININAQAEKFEKQTENINKKINNEIEKLSTNTDLSYYASNIYAYSILEDIKVEIKNGGVKYKDTMQLSITHNLLDKDKHKSFLMALSHLGYIEGVEKQKLTLNVKQISIADAKNIINKNEVTK